MRPKVAANLLVWNSIEVLEPMLKSLKESDAWPVDLFWYDNGSEQDHSAIKKKYEAFTPWYRREWQNQGIINPRIAIQSAIMDEGYEYTLELHADMRFPKKWFKPLMDEMKADEKCALAMPKLLACNPASPKPPISQDQLERLAEEHREPGKRLRDGRHTFPWIMRNSISREVGYYDPVFHPYRAEDPDLVYRFRQAGYNCTSVLDSVVWHALMYSPFLFGWQNHDKIFFDKHGCTIAETLGFHPVVRLGLSEV